MRTFPTAIAVARHTLWNSDAFYWLAEIGSAAGGFYRLCKGERAVVAGGETWRPGLEDVSVPAENADGALGEARIVVPNPSRLPLAIADSGDLDAQPVRILVAHESALVKLQAACEWSMVILSLAADAARLTITGGHPAEISRVPSGVFTRSEFPGMVPGAGLRR